MQAFYESLTQYDGFNANAEVEGELLENFYPGLSGIAAKQRVIYMPMMSSVVCEVALVEVESASDVQAVKDIFQARIDAQAGGGAWYPDSVEAWKNDSRVVSNGNCVMMIAWNNCDTAVAAFNALF